MEKINFQDLPSTSTPLSSTNLNQMQDNMEDAIIPIKLVTISDTAPSTATTGDMYYNTTDNKVYTAIATNTWGSGSTPRYDGFYVNTSDNTLFYYNGATLVGAGGSQTSINVKNEETTSETDVYSCNYVNNIDNKFNYSSNEQIVGKWIDGKTLYRKVITFNYFPNDGQRNVAHYITNLQYICWYEYTWYDSSDAKFFSNVRFDNSTTYCKISISNTYLIVEGRGTNWSTRTSDGTCIIYYTKTTD